MTPGNLFIHGIQPPVVPSGTNGDPLGMITRIAQLARPFTLSRRSQERKRERTPALDTSLTVEPGTSGMNEEIGLRSFTLSYPNAPRTWVMDVERGALMPPRPAPANSLSRITEASAVATIGFWNNIPLEEQREPVQLMPPTYGEGRKQSIIGSGVDVREMAILLGLTYLFLVLAHVGILIIRFTA